MLLVPVHRGLQTVRLGLGHRADPLPGQLLYRRVSRIRSQHVLARNEAGQRIPLAMLCAQEDFGPPNNLPGRRGQPLLQSDSGHENRKVWLRLTFDLPSFAS